MKLLTIIHLCLLAILTTAQSSIVDGGSSSLVPVGVILPFAGTNAPTGWALCDGRKLKNTDYPELYAILGRIHTSLTVSVDSFAVPDLRGRFVRMLDVNSGLDPDKLTRTRIDGQVGDVVGSIQNEAIASHSHTYDKANTSIVPAGIVSILPGNGAQIEPASTTSSGGNETRPKNIALNFIIKLK